MSAYSDLDVSRETRGRLDLYADILRQWNSRINLVSPKSIEDLWQRHILDSVQLFHLVPAHSRLWVDLGSGGGFPGMVIAIIALEKQPAMSVTLIESDQRKAAFLRTVIRETEAPATVINSRIETAPSQKADVVSARALAPLPSLLPLVRRHLHPQGVALLPKGARWEKEYQEATKAWTFGVQVHKSKTDANAVILEIQELSDA